MKLNIEVTFENVDVDWLKWYCEGLEESGLPDAIRASRAITGLKDYSFTSNDPVDTKVKATTTYSVEV